jgi:uncharacterized membrane-anchored protein YitT (DUF2179 family)
MAHPTGQPHGQAPTKPFSAPAVRTGGRIHPLQDTLAGITVVLGLIAITTCLFHGLHLLASWTGLFGIITAAWGQYLSETTAERFLLIIGGVAAAVGLGIGVAHGGLFGGVLGY